MKSGVNITSAKTPARATVEKVHEGGMVLHELFTMSIPYCQNPIPGIQMPPKRGGVALGKICLLLQAKGPGRGSDHARTQAAGESREVVEVRRYIRGGRNVTLHARTVEERLEPLQVVPAQPSTWWIPH
jgi:hypothetical protein